MEAGKRVFAAEFTCTTLFVDPPGRTQPPVVITPSGARCHLMFISGALTERKGRKGTLMQARLADPTGAFDLLIGPEQHDAAAALEQMSPPLFVTVLGDARIYRTGNEISPYIRPEEICVADRIVRDSWVIRTAEITLGRLEAAAKAVESGAGSPDVMAAVRHYGLDRSRISGMAEMVRVALEKVQPVGGGEISPPDPMDIVLEIIRSHGGGRGIGIPEIVSRAASYGIEAGAVEKAVETLIREDECYQPAPGVIKLL